MVLQTVLLSKSFGSLEAVKTVSMGIQEGKITSIIGPNGAGKTTLFDLISGRLHPDSGRVLFRGEDITGLPPYVVTSKGIGKVFQIPSVLPRLTVFENIQVACISFRGKSLDLWSSAKNILRKEATDILETVGLAELGGTQAGTLSYGHQRRLEIGMTLANQPVLLLLDEPTAGISPAEAEELMGFIEHLVRDHGLTTLLVEHDLNVVFAYSDTITVMNFGEIVMEGKPEEVRSNPDVQRIYIGEEKP